MYRNMLASVSCDWETVKNVVTGNSSSKPDRTGRDGKFVKQSKMLNNSAYSRLGNKCQCDTQYDHINFGYINDQKQNKELDQVYVFLVVLPIKVLMSFVYVVKTCNTTTFGGEAH